MTGRTVLRWLGIGVAFAGLLILLFFVFLDVDVPLEMP